MVLELVPEQLAAAITERLRIPTIGIGAGAGCSGQVQVITDLIGLGDFVPRHARPYAHVRETILEAAARLRGGRSGRHVPGRRPRPSAWTTPSSTTSSGAAHRIGRPARSRPGASRSTATSRSTAARLTQVVRTRAELARRPRPGRAAGRARPHDGLAPRGPSRADAAGPRRPTRRPSSRSSSTRASSTSPPTTPSTRATRRATWRSAEAEGVDIVFAPDAARGLSAGLRHRRVGRRGRAATGGCRAARPFRRRRDGRGDPVRPGRRRARLLRAEGRPAGDGHPPDGARPGDPDRGDRLPDRPRAGRPRALVAERPPLPGRASRGAGPASRAAGGACPMGGRRTVGGARCATRCGRRWPPNRSPTSNTSRSRTARRSAELERVDGPALLSLAVRFGTTRLIDNEPLGDRPAPT